MSISPATPPPASRVRPAVEAPPPFHGEDTLVLSPASSATDRTLARPKTLPADFSPDLRSATAPSSHASRPQESKSVTVQINEWAICEKDTSYLVDTAGCGAIKIFVQGAQSSYDIAFHIFGTKDSDEAAVQIGQHILSKKDRPESVQILCIQPYAINRDVMDTVDLISDAIAGAGTIKTNVRAVCLNNIDCEKFTQFVQVDLKGTEQEIVDRYAHLVLKSAEMSDEDRRQKMQLFQGLPMSARTPEFIRKWSPLSLDEARKTVDELANNTKKESLWSRVGHIFS